MPPQRIPHYTRLAKPQKGSAPRNVSHQRFHAFLLCIYSNMFDRPKDKMCVIIRLMFARNDLTGVFLDRHGRFDRPLWQSLRCLGSPMLWPALFVYSISIRLKSGPLKHWTGIFLSVRGGKKGKHKHSAVSNAIFETRQTICIPGSGIGGLLLYIDHLRGRPQCGWNIVMWPNAAGLAWDSLAWNWFPRSAQTLQNTACIFYFFSLSLQCWINHSTLLSGVEASLLSRWLGMSEQGCKNIPALELLLL